MTCIIGIQHNNLITIGGDSAGVAGLDIEVRADEKVFNKIDEQGNEWLFGFTSSFRMGQLIRYALELPNVSKIDLKDEEAFNRVMVLDFIDCVRRCFEDKGWLRTKADREYGGAFIVGVKGRLFVIEDDFQVAIPASGFTAIGCGELQALGSLYTTAALGKPVDTRLRAKLALEAAEAYSGGVRSPYVILRGAK